MIICACSFAYMLAYMLIYAYGFASRVTYTMHIVSPYMFTTPNHAHDASGYDRRHGLLFRY